MKKEFTQSQVSDLIRNYENLIDELNIQANRIEQQKNNTVESFRRFNGLGGFTHFMDQELKKSVDYDGLFKKAKTEFTENLVHRIHIKSFLPEMLQVANEIQRNIEKTQKIQRIKDDSIFWNLHFSGWQKRMNKEYTDQLTESERVAQRVKKYQDELDKEFNLSSENLAQEFDSCNDLCLKEFNWLRETFDLGEVMNNLPSTVRKKMDQAAEIHDVYEKITQQINKNREVLSSFEVNTGALSKQDFSLNHYLREGKEISRSSESKQAVSNLCQYSLLLPYKSWLSEIVFQNKSSIKLLTESRDSLDAEKWFFKKQVNKNEFRHEYDQISKFLTDSVKGKLAGLHRQEKKAQQLSDHFDSEIYSQLLENHLPQIKKVAAELTSRNQPRPSVIKNLDTVFSKKSKIFQKPDELIEIKKKEAKKQVTLVVTNLVIKKMQEIPVSQCSKSIRGLRVKTLNDYNYNNMADIYAASGYQISSINGISDAVAFALRHQSEVIFKSLKEEAKIQITQLERTSELEKLIWILYSILELQKFNDYLYELKDEDYKTCEEYLADLKHCKLGVDFLARSEAELSEMYREYQFVRNFIKNWEGFNDRSLEKRLEQVIIPAPETAWNDFKNHPVPYITLMENFFPELTGTDADNYGLPDELARAVIEQDYFPEGLKVNLRKYQIWGVKYALHQENVLLGDDMGLGKTAQAIATMVSLRNTGSRHFMVICPLSVLINWSREIAEFSRLRSTTVYGSNYQDALNSWIKTGGVAITTYETAQKIVLPATQKLDLLVVDEAHYVKNPAAKRSKAVQALSKKASHRLFMTGTPIENNIDEMLSLIRMIQPRLFPEISQFAANTYARAFRDAIAPVYFRRKKEDVLTELPEKIESYEWCEMSPEEKRVYEREVLDRSYMEIRQLSWNVDNLMHSSKAARLREIVAEAKSNDSRVIVFSYFIKTIRAVERALNNKCSIFGPITGSVPTAKRQDIIDRFSKSAPGSVLLSQITAGGTGLNIQAANVVILCEPQFKPSIEQQAIARAHRMGQTKNNVLVYRLLCEDTIEEKLINMLRAKQKIFDDFADKSTAAERIQGQGTIETDMRDSAEIDQKTFHKLIEEEIEIINRRNAGKGN